MSTTQSITYQDFSLPLKTDWLSFVYENKEELSLLVQSEIEFDFLRIEEQGSKFKLRIATSDEEAFIISKEQLVGLNFIKTESSSFQVERFGGAHVIPRIRSFFTESSKSILNLLINHEEAFEYEDLLSIAVFMGKTLFQNISLDNVKQRACLSLYFKHWKSFLPEDIDLLKIKAMYQEEVGILKTIEQIKPIHTWSEALQLHFEAWTRITNKLIVSLNELDAQNLVEQRGSNFKYNTGLDLSNERNLFEIYNDCFHFTLNKIGINNEDEALVIYLIAELMETPLEDI